MTLRDETVLRHEHLALFRTIGCVGPYTVGRVGFIEQIGDPQPKKAFPSQAVTHEIVCGLVAQAVHRLRISTLNISIMIEKLTAAFDAIPGPFCPHQRICFGCGGLNPQTIEDLTH